MDCAHLLLQHGADVTAQNAVVGHHSQSVAGIAPYCSARAYCPSQSLPVTLLARYIIH